MVHPLESTIREAYTAFGLGDVDGYLQTCTEDFSFNVPGRGAIPGSWHGKKGLYALARQVMQVSGGSFREEVEDVLANGPPRCCTRTKPIYTRWPIKRLQNCPCL